MIDIKVRHNLEQVIDYVGKMNNDIQAVIATAIEIAKEDVYNELINTYQIGYDDLNIDITFEGSNYKITVEGINPYQLYNNIGIDMDYILNIIENKLVDSIQQHINNSGYGYGNQRI